MVIKGGMKMKKFIYFFAAAVAAFSLASCNKENMEDTKPSELKLNISVSYFGGATTKAVKTGWTAGDKINIWYDGNNQYPPDLVIKYDGSEWTKDSEAVLSGNEPAERGKIYFIYEASNNLSRYTYEGGPFRGTANLTYTDSYWYPTIYTYAEGILSFSIEAWIPGTEFQVVVTDIDPSKYELMCDILHAGYGFYVSKGVFLYSTDVDQYTSGFANEDGTAFYFTDSAGSVEADYTFTLKNIETNEEKTYIAYAKKHRQYSFTAIKIDVNKFK